MINDMTWFLKTSGIIGSDIDLVQGTGGNISVKIGDKMIIKSSGIRLDSITNDSGYSIVNYKNIAKTYQRNLSEPQANKLIYKSVLNRSIPSLETGFHSFLKKYVVHAHSPTINIITCSLKSLDILSDIFKNFLWVPYTKVGYKLSKEIYNRLEKNTNLIFLENHGVIVSSDSGSECLKFLYVAREKIKHYLKSRIKTFYSFSYNDLLKKPDYFLNSSHYPIRKNVFKRCLFPDACVFSKSKKVVLTKQGIKYFMDYYNARNVDEILSAHIYIENMIRLLGEPKYLTKKEFDDILSMSSEKYRRRLVGV